MQAVAAALTLIAANDTIVIRPANAVAGDPIVCREWNLGAPDVRSSGVDRSNADGIIDRAGYTGARTVTLDLQIFGDDNGSPYDYAERLSALTHPSQRPVLRITRQAPETAGQTWDLDLRGAPSPVAYGRRAAALLEMQLSFTAPIGYLQGNVNTYSSLDPTTLTVGGSAPVAPVIFIHGPCTNPEVNTEDGERFVFTEVSFNEGHHVRIDMDAGTVRYDSDPAATMYHKMNFGVSTFWRWNPGVHVVNYLPGTGHAIVQWRNRRYTI